MKNIVTKTSGGSSSSTDSGKPPSLTADTLKPFFERAPIYVSHVFLRPDRLPADLPSPVELDLYCKQCKLTKPFQDRRSRGSGSGLGSSPAITSGLRGYRYWCVTCGAAYTADVFVEISESSISIQKVGQWPRPKSGRDKLLEKFFEEDAENYEKAVMCLANGYGIGAFAYFRRIIEDGVDQLLNMLEDDAKATGSGAEILNAISELHKASPMADKIEIANKAVPPHLLVNGINPLGRLYGVLSDGVHGLSDAQCLEKAEVVQDCLKYLVSELSMRRTNRDQFAKKLGRL